MTLDAGTVANVVSLLSSNEAINIKANRLINPAYSNEVAERDQVYQQDGVSISDVSERSDVFTVGVDLIDVRETVTKGQTYASTISAKGALNLNVAQNINNSTQKAHGSGYSVSGNQHTAQNTEISEI